MKGDLLPDSDRVTRYCSPTRLDEQGRPTAEAFRLRPGEDYLSVNWLEMHQGDDQARLEAVRHDLRRTGMQLSPRGRLALLRIGETVELVRRESPDHRLLGLTHEPTLPGDSHAALHHTNHTALEMLVAELLAQAVAEVAPTVEGR